MCSWKRCPLHPSTLSPWHVYSFLILMSTKIWSASSLQWVTALISSLCWSRVPVWGRTVRMVGLLDRQPQQKLSGQGQGRDKSDSRPCPPRTHLGHPSLPHPSLRSFLWCLPTSILRSLTKVGGSLGAQCHQLVGAGINGVVTSPLLRVDPASIPPPMDGAHTQSLPCPPVSILRYGLFWWWFATLSSDLARSFTLIFFIWQASRKVHAIHTHTHRV